MIAFLLSVALLFFTNSADIEEVVKEFHQLKSEQEEANFIDLYQEDKNASVQAYVVSVSMKQAEYPFNPRTKLKIFKLNKELLNQLVHENQSNVHLRYVRLVAQESTPTVFGYNEHIEADKSFLKRALETADESDFLDIYIKNNTSL